MRDDTKEDLRKKKESQKGTRQGKSVQNATLIAKR